MFGTGYVVQEMGCRRIRIAVCPGNAAAGQYRSRRAGCSVICVFYSGFPRPSKLPGSSGKLGSGAASRVGMTRVGF